jgi:hypothetical protein
MRQFILTGFVILGLGAFVLLRGASFTSWRDVLTISNVKVTPAEEHSSPIWAGGAAMLVGGALMLAGTRKRA